MPALGKDADKDAVKDKDEDKEKLKNAIAYQAEAVRELKKVASQHAYYRYNYIWTQEVQNMVIGPDLTHEAQADRNSALPSSTTAGSPNPADCSASRMWGASWTFK